MAYCTIPVWYVYLSFLPARSWVAALDFKMDPAKKEEIKRKGDTGMVKKNYFQDKSKTVSVYGSVHILVDIKIIKCIFWNWTCFSLPWCLTMAQKPCVASGPEADL